MKKHVRSIASMVLMSVFLILALSCNCIFSNYDCFGGNDIPCNPYMNAYKGTSQINIKAKDYLPLEGVNLVVTVEKFRVTKEDDKCKLLLKETFTKKFVTNEFGLAYFDDYNEFLSPGDKNVITVKASRSFYQSNATRFIKKNNFNNTIEISLVGNLLFP